jgi:hypothetical protein
MGKVSSRVEIEGQVGPLADPDVQAALAGSP